MTDSLRKLNLEYDRVLKVKNWFNFDRFREKFKKKLFKFYEKIGFKINNV
jgi:hypothetical protein